MDKYPGAITIVENWQVVTGSEMAFPYVRELYELRAELKRSGDSREKSLKLVLNSGYGKLAQSVGFMGRTPAYQCYAMAGLITSYTRARIMEVIGGRDADIIAVATDGVLSRVPIAAPGPDLGDWEIDEYERLEIYKPGTFRKFAGGKVSTRIRGFRAIDFDRLLESYRTEGIGATVTMPETRFIGMKSAARVEDWGTWVTGNRTMGIYPFGSTPNELPGGNYELIPPYDVGESLPYTKESAKENHEIIGILNEDLDEDGYE
jgi:hypothetical protein